jgi:hypothetical protein
VKHGTPHDSWPPPLLTVLPSSSASSVTTLLDLSFLFFTFQEKLQ